MSRALERLVGALVSLPGIGYKTGQRIALHVLGDRDGLARELASAIDEARQLLHPCKHCYALTEDAECEVCADSARDSQLICVVENHGDVLALEQTGSYRGHYHVLGGALSPIDNVGPDDLRIRELVERTARGNVREVIIATNPTTEGEATAAYVAHSLRETRIPVTRIARGLPVGSDLELADADTLSRAFEGRREL